MDKEMKIKAINLILKNRKLNVAQKIQQISRIEGVTIETCMYKDHIKNVGGPISRECKTLDNGLVIADIGVQNGILFWMML